SRDRKTAKRPGHQPPGWIGRDQLRNQGPCHEALLPVQGDRAFYRAAVRRRDCTGHGAAAVRRKIWRQSVAGEHGAVRQPASWGWAVDQWRSGAAASIITAA